MISRRRHAAQQSAASRLIPSLHPLRRHDNWVYHRDIFTFGTLFSWRLTAVELFVWMMIMNLPLVRPMVAVNLLVTVDTKSPSIVRRSLVPCPWCSHAEMYAKRAHLFSSAGSASY